ncbi:MAG: acyltransferase [Saprospiraceae bacterium]|nr:acyltransferase [Saprospiraceae bacterium]
MRFSYIQSLTHLRGIAAIMTLMFHFHLLVVPLHDPTKYALISKWHLLVDLFPVLSGFIIYYVYSDYFKQGLDTERFKKYIWARLARIYPLHFFTLPCSIGLYVILKYHQVEFTPVENHILDTNAIPISLLLNQAWDMHLEAAWNTPGWSISVEWFIYLLFPFFINVFWSPCPRRRIILAAAIFTTLLVVIYQWQPYNFFKRLSYLRNTADDWLRNRYTVDVITGPALLRGLAGFTISLLKVNPVTIRHN